MSNESVPTISPPQAVTPDRESFVAGLQEWLGDGPRSGGAAAIFVADFRANPLLHGARGGDLPDEAPTTEWAASVAKLLAEAEPSPNESGGRSLAAPIGPTRIAVALQPCEGPSARARAHTLRARIATMASASGTVSGPTPFIGIAIVKPGTTGAGEALERAEMACFCAARQGDRIPHLYTETMGRWAARRLPLERSLCGALERGELAVHFQPRMLASTRVTVGVEALLRWNHPSLGLVPPMQFIPIAEETGLILPIGEWVLRETCRQVKAWSDEGLPSVVAAVNVSAMQFHESHFAETVRRALDATGLPPNRLELELTESILMRDPEAAIECLRALRAQGVRVAIDDFGTGYSSLAYLKRFPVDVLKIDQSFIRHVAHQAQDAAITTAILVLGHSLGLRVVAEGVETESQLSFLKVLGCDEVQGFLLARPAPAPDVRERLVREAGAEARPSES